MFKKLILILTLYAAYVTASNHTGFISKKQVFASNPCLGRNEPHFAPNSRGCSWYFECDNNEIKREDRCAFPLHFNYLYQRCDYRENVRCELDDRWRNLQCTDENKISVIPHPYSCSMYTICFNGIQNDRTCPPRTHFSYYDNKCVDPFYADCSIDYELCKESVETGIPTLIRNSRDCESYFACVAGVSFPLRCTPGTQFNPETSLCQDPEIVQCVPEIPPNPPRIPDTVFIDCGDEVGNVPHPEVCDFYFFCTEERSYLQKCGEGLIFDFDLRRCYYADRSRCDWNDETTTEPEGSAEEDENEFGTNEKLIEVDVFEMGEDDWSPDSEGFIHIKNAT